jgi:hypothetical protein
MSKTNDTSGLGRAALENPGTLADTELDTVSGGFATAFLTTVDGHAEATWTPRSYAVQSDLSGGVTGGQASLYERRRP